jgi:hypothetical protein
MNGFSSCRQGALKYRLPHILIHLSVVQNFHTDISG